MGFSKKSTGGTSILGKTATEMYALTGTDGQIIYNTTYKHHFKWIVDRWVPNGEPDPRYGLVLKDDFISTSGTFDLNWGNAATVSASTGGATTPGVALLRKAAALDRASMTQAVTGFLLGTMDIYQEWLVRFPTLATALEDYCFAVGFNDCGAYDANSLATDGVYFTYNRAVNGANWNLHTVSNGSATNTTNLVSAIAADTWYRLGILIKAGTSAAFSVNGSVIGTHTTNIPTGAGRGTHFQARLDKTVGSVNSDIHLDYFYSWGFFSGVRS